MKKNIKMVMGGKLYRQLIETDRRKTAGDEIDAEKYFRPSNLPVINNRSFESDLFNGTYDILPDYLLKTPDDTIINYFSILRQAANPKNGKNAGCGTLGYAKSPYPVAYKFLSSEYQRRMNYKQYLKSFENILHINLIKLKRIYFKGTDENDYLIEFFQLTNDTDIEIAQYKKSANGEWELIKLDPKKCLE